MNIAAHTNAPAIPWAEADRSHAELVCKTDIIVEVITGRVVAASAGASVGGREIREAPLIEDEFPVQSPSVPFSAPVMISLKLERNMPMNCRVQSQGTLWNLLSLNDATTQI